MFPDAVDGEKDHEWVESDKIDKIDGMIRNRKEPATNGS